MTLTSRKRTADKRPTYAELVELLRALSENMNYGERRDRLLAILTRMDGAK